MNTAHSQDYEEVTARDMFGVFDVWAQITLLGALLFYNGWLFIESVIDGKEVVQDDETAEKYWILGGSFVFWVCLWTWIRYGPPGNKLWNLTNRIMGVCVSLWVLRAELLGQRKVFKMDCFQSKALLTLRVGVVALFEYLVTKWNNNFGGYVLVCFILLQIFTLISEINLLFDFDIDCMRCMRILCTRVFNNPQIDIRVGFDGSG